MTFTTKLVTRSQAPVAHACNPRNSGGRDQEDHGSKPAWANSSQGPISKKKKKTKNPTQKRVGGVAQVVKTLPLPPPKTAGGVGLAEDAEPEFKSQHHTHKHMCKKPKTPQTLQN
jgi:hypothetical protein